MRTGRSDQLNQTSFLTDQQLACRWGISPKTLRNARVKGGPLPFVRIGRLIRYRLSDVESYEAGRTRTSTSQEVAL